jgi:hypothetical protein
VDAGVSIREIQLLLGHKNLYTTMRYLDQQDFNRITRDKIKDKLTEIHINANSSVISSLPLTSGEKSEEIEIHMVSTPLATCKNIFSPPDFVKELPSYVPGKACSIYNMCLRCPNNILTTSDLPKLFAMKRDYLFKIQNSRVLDTPFGQVIRDNLELINLIITPESSDFTIEELNEAENLSIYIETTEIT